jgi:hypothetical protein
MITHEFLKQILHYDPVFTWKSDRGSSIKAGARAGSIHRRGGQRVITINRKQYYSNRLAWFYQTGEWPAHPIDHINFGGRT